MAAFIPRIIGTILSSMANKPDRFRDGILFP